MKASKVHIDLDGDTIVLDGLDAEERRLLAGLRRRARTRPDWCDFDTHWMRTVTAFYDARGVARKALVRLPVYRVAQDLGSRLGIAAGLIQPPDYRDELQALIRDHFPSPRAFCQVTGIPEKVLRDVLAGRKDLPLDMLNTALERVGYRLRIMPVGRRKKTG